MSDATNTIIVTSKDDNVLAQVEFLQDWLQENVLRRIEITAQHPIQLIVLRNFKRVLICSPNLHVSRQIMATPLPRSLYRSYSPLNTLESTEYLQLPKGERLFLISPPTSPPPEFDYSRCEEPPSNPSQPRRHQNMGPSGHTDVPVTILNSNVANITVYPCTENQSEEFNMENYQPTAMPPKSIFDNSDDEA